MAGILDGRNNQSKNFYTFDIDLTQDCNFACKYCIERGYFDSKYMTMETANNLIDKIEYLRSSPYGKEGLGITGILLSYWGGEPTMNPTILNHLTRRYMDDPSIEFKVFTNSLLLVDYLDLIDEVNDRFKDIYPERNRFAIQVSYDGLAVHNPNRIDRSGKETGELVRSNIIELAKRNQWFNLKSTISYTDLDKLYDAYLDVCNLSDECREIDSTKPPLVYSPTLDYSVISYNRLTDADMVVLLQIFESQLIQIAKEEIRRMEAGKSQIFSWFIVDGNPRKCCAAGFKYKHICYDGKVIVCHGCTFTENSSDHIVADVNISENDRFVENLAYSDHKLKDYIKEPGSCSTCNSLICYRCNAVKYEQSKKESYLDRWYDFSNQPKLCQFHNKASNVFRAMKILYENKVINLNN